MKARILTLAVIVTAATACGTTVPLGDRQGLATGQGSTQASVAAGTSTVGGGRGGASASGSTAGGGSAGPPAAAGSNPAGSGASGAAGTSTGGSSGVATAAGASRGAGGAGAKVASSAPTSAHSPVQVGYVVFPDFSAFSSELGGTGQSTGDGPTEIKAIVDWINSHGGLAGHPITPVIASVALTSTSSYASESQAVCNTFTQDNHVVAATFIGNAPDVLVNCLNSRHVLLLTQGDELHDAAYDTAYPYLVSPAEADASKVATTLVTQTFDRGLLESGDTVGLMVEQYAAPERAASQVVIPMMKAHGVNVVEYTVTEPSSTPDISGSVSQVSSAELKMAASNVRTVMFLCTGCMPFFMQDAASQHYYPRYLFTSFDGPYGYSGSSYAAQLSNSFGIGFEPVTDVGPETHASVVKSNPTFAQCQAIEVPTGQVTSDTSDYAAQAYCDISLWIYNAAKAEGASTVSTPALIAGLNRLGSSHVSSLDFSNDVTPSTHNGISSYRFMSWHNDCQCLFYDDSVDRPFN